MSMRFLFIALSAIFLIHLAFKSSIFLRKPKEIVHVIDNLLIKSKYCSAKIDSICCYT